MIIQTRYIPGRFGLGTEFAESKIPLEYSQKFQNRFININGDAEKRQGITQKGDTITGNPTITGIHEYIDNDGNSTILASENGNIWRLNETTGAWTQVLTGKDSTKRLYSVQMGDKLIFVNGSDRNFFTDDAGDSFSELKAIINRGQTSSTSTSAQGLSDSNVESWLADTFVNTNDLVFNSNKNAYGIITSVGTTNIQHTAIGSAGEALGSAAGGNQNSGDFYQIIDLVALNIIPQNNSLDNFATGTAGTSAAGVAVSGVNWLDTEARKGDFVHNTTRSAVTQVSAVSTAQLTVKPVSGQTANDSFQFFKTAMPISTWAHVHFGRAYYIDERDQGTVRISGPDDPQDMTTYQRTLETASEKYGSRQPQAERLLTLKTFHKYLVAGGERNVYADRGISPIADTTADAVDFSPVGVFPQGNVSPLGLENVGGTMNFIADDGVRNFTASFDDEAFQTSNISEYIKTEIANEIDSKQTDPTEIQCVHYPRRNWLLCKIGDVIYNYNYTPYYLNGQTITGQIGSWSRFTGLFAEQKAFFVRRNGDLLCAGPEGKLYEFDKGSYNDDGATITTTLETGWLKLTEFQDDTKFKNGTYIKPEFENAGSVTYTIEATGDFSQLSTDSVTLDTPGVGQIGFSQIGSSPIGGRRISDQKLPLRWKGEQFKIRITTDNTTGPDIITGFTVYGNTIGKI